MSDFVIARNPAEGSRLPYLLLLPLRDGDVVLASRDLWPRAGDLYCHPVAAWPEAAEEVLREPVEQCWRAGSAIHLVLRRRSERRALFVWTTARGREMIFWRSAQSMRGARPGVRIPGAMGLENGTVTIAVDTRERYPWKFTEHDVQTIRRSLPAGDYAVLDEAGSIIGAVERKRVADLATSVVGGGLTVVIAELAQAPRAAIVVEGRLSDVIKHAEHAGVATGWLLNAIAALQIAHPRVNWMFAETRKLGEDWAFRWLSAASRMRLDSDGADPAALVLRDAGARRQLVLAEDGLEWDAVRLAERAGVSLATAGGDLRRLADTGMVRREQRGRRVVFVTVGEASTTTRS